MALGSLLQFSGRRRLPLLLQAEAGECGLACLAMVAGWHGLRLDLASLRQRFPVSAQGARLRELMATAEALDLAARPLRLEVTELGSLTLPALLHWDMGHFVVLRAVRGGQAVLHDPAIGERRLPLAEVSRHFTGVALELRPTPGFSPGEARRRIPLAAFWQQVRGARGTLVQLLVLSLLLQVFALAGPFHMQLVVDEAIAGNAADLLTVLAMGFGLLLVLQVATSVLRGWVLMVLGNSLAFGFALRLFRHLLALPLAWFERRHLGDVLARFGSLGPVQGLLTEGLVATVVDGLMAVTTLAMLLLYAPDLALVVLAAVAVYTVLRLAMVPVLRRRTAEQIAAGAREQTVFMESVRAVQAIKVFGRESQRLGLWQQRQAERLNAGMALTRLGLLAGALNGLVFGIEGILVIWLGAAKVLGGGFSVGMLYAFMAWRGQFTGRVAALVDRALELRLLGLHLERLADIALAEPEPGSGAAPLAAAGEDAPAPRFAAGLAPIRGELRLSGVAFRWQTDGPALFEGLDLHVPAGSCLALVGPSGCGKTTLGKLLLGLHRPERGEVLVDGQPLGAAALPAYRRQVAAVLQDDVLLAGTLADNIAMFDPQRDDQQVLSVARLAGIHATIAALPLQYQTLVGDMGLSLSGGQRQRLLLARALYQRPRVLLLDEGTAHLDPETTATVLEGLAALRMTRVLITHDPAVAAMADQVLDLGAALPGAAAGVAPEAPVSGYHPLHAGHRLHGRDA